MRCCIRTGNNCDRASLDRDRLIHCHTLALEDVVDMYLWVDERDGALGWHRRLPDSVYPNASRRTHSIDRRLVQLMIFGAIPSRESNEGDRILSDYSRCVKSCAEPKQAEQIDAAEVRALRVPNSDQPPHPADHGRYPAWIEHHH